MNKETDTTLTCIVCPIGCGLRIKKTENGYKIVGNKCPRGEKYALEEMTAPKRMVTTTVKITGSAFPVIPVKTQEPVLKEKIFDVMEILSRVTLTSPVKIGDIVVKNIADTRVDVMCTKEG